MNDKLDRSSRRAGGLCGLAALIGSLFLSGCVVPPPQPILLTNPTGLGTVASIPTGAATHLECREFQQTITVNGEKHKAYGQACHQPDGTWKLTP